MLLRHADLVLSARKWGSKAGISLRMMLHRVSLSMPRYPWISRLRVAMTSRHGICGLSARTASGMCVVASPISSRLRRVRVVIQSAGNETRLVEAVGVSDDLLSKADHVA